VSGVQLPSECSSTPVFCNILRRKDKGLKIKKLERYSTKLYNRGMIFLKIRTNINASIMKNLVYILSS